MRRYPVWLPGLRFSQGAGLAIVALAVGPAVIVLAASDQNEPFKLAGTLTSLFFGSGFGAYFAVVAAYSFIVADSRDRRGFIRIALSLVVLVIILAVGLTTSLPLLFGIGESNLPVLGSTVVYCFWVMLAAIAHRLVLRSGVVASVEVPAYVLTFLIPILLFGLPWIGNGRASMIAAAQVHFLGGWPAIAAVLPFAAILVWRGTPFGVARGMRLIAGMIAVVYFGKATIDAVAGKELAAFWPVRVVSEFSAPLPGNPRAIDVVSRQAGERILIGVHAYRFGQSINEISWDSGAVTYAASVPSDELGIPASETRKGLIEIEFRVWRPGPLFKGIGGVWIRHQDLAIRILRHQLRNQGPPDSEARQKAQEYFAKAQEPD